MASLPQLQSHTSTRQPQLRSRQVRGKSMQSAGRLRDNLQSTCRPPAHSARLSARACLHSVQLPVPARARTQLRPVCLQPPASPSPAPQPQDSASGTPSWLQPLDRHLRPHVQRFTRHIAPRATAGGGDQGPPSGGSGGGGGGGGGGDGNSEGSGSDKENDTILSIKEVST